MPDPHSDALRLLRSWQAPAPHLEQVRRQFLTYVEAHRDAPFRHCAPAHLTASTVVLDADLTRVLLTHHVKADAWFQFGGHIETDDGTVLDAARREAEEESGVAGLVLDPTPVHLSAHTVPFCRGDGSHTTGDMQHFDVRFVALAPGGTVPVVSEESHDVRWWPLSQLPNRDEDLVEAIDLARQRAERRGG